MHLLDTSVVIALRDGSLKIEEQFASLPLPVGLSVITRIELEGGAATSGEDGLMRRERLDPLLAAFTILPFDQRAADIYRSIVRQIGFSRRKTLDRMIAAQAIVANAAFVTLNAADFRDIPGLKLLEW